MFESEADVCFQQSDCKAKEVIFSIVDKKIVSGMSERGRQGGQLPPQILADQKAPQGSVGAPHYYLPPQIFRLCNVPECDERDGEFGTKKLCAKIC